MRTALLLLVMTALLATGTQAPAAPETASLILYRSAPSTTTDASVVRLWSTDGTGRHARQVAVIHPVGRSEGLQSAYLTPDGVMFAATNPNDGNVADISFVARGATHARVLFSVRGLVSFRPSLDGERIAYARQLPVAGMPLTVIARRNGNIIQTLAHAASKTLSWSNDGRFVFAYGVTARCWFCVFSTSTGTGQPMKINTNNLLGGWPSVSPSGHQVAMPDATGPAGERIYTRSGGFIRNLVGHAAAEAVWAPDEQRLLLQADDHLDLFDFKSKRIGRFAHGGPSDLRVLDWRAIPTKA